MVGFNALGNFRNSSYELNTSLAHYSKKLLIILLNVVIFLGINFFERGKRPRVRKDALTHEKIDLR